jgi:hypothetical protein
MGSVAAFQVHRSINAINRTCQKRLQTLKGTGIAGEVTKLEGWVVF